MLFLPFFATILLMPQIHKKVVKNRDGLDLYYETYITGTEKPELFFLHGIGGDLDAWGYVIDELSGKGFSCIAMDLRGHGYSDHPRAFQSYAVDNLVQDVVAVMDQENMSKATLIGHCYGAVIATYFALSHSEKLNGLAVISSTYQHPWYLRSKAMRALANGFINVLAFFSPKPFRPRHSPYPPGKFHKDYELLGLVKTISHNSLRSYLLATKQIVNLDLERRLAGITTPTLIIAGEKDSIFPLSVSQTIHTAIAGSRFEIIKEANHVVILNNVTQVVNSLHSFLKEIDEDSRP